MNNKTYTCCLCGEKQIGYGNNPFPASQSGLCCNNCNISIVIPMRIRLLKV